MNLKEKIKDYLAKEQLLKDKSYAILKKSYLEKARKNLSVANLLMKISDDKKVKNFLKLPEDFGVYDWVIITAYYAMYSSALAALVNLNYKSRSHAATVAILRYYYVYGQKLNRKDIQKLEKAKEFSELLIKKLIKIKSRRESAQYDAEPAISRINAEISLKDANEFISKIEEVIS